MAVDQKLKALEGLLAGISIQIGLDIPEDAFTPTEPLVLEDECSVVGLAPAKGGPVGLDADTGRPMQLGWKYKSIDEKPVIIHNGRKQTVIPPTPKPPPAPRPPSVTAAEAVDLYNALHGRLGVAGLDGEVRVRQAFVAGCLADPDFYARCRARLAPEPPPDPGRPGPPRTRQRIVDT
jgi:hypothetical protein